MGEVKKGTVQYDRKLNKTKVRKRLASQQHTLKKPFVRKAIKQATLAMETENEKLRQRSNHHMRAAAAAESRNKVLMKKNAALEAKIRDSEREISKAKADTNTKLDKERARTAKILMGKQSEIEKLKPALASARKQAMQWGWVLAKVDAKSRKWLLRLAEKPLRQIGYSYY